MEHFHAFNAHLDATFDAAPTAEWMHHHVEVPIFAIAIYAAMVFWGQDHMTDRKAWNLKPFFIVWNFILSTFSILGAIFAVPYLHQLVTGPGGWKMSVCNPGWRAGGYFQGASGFWFIAFAFSKFPELIDTFFLVFQKKPVIFLHWYHHITVLLYCWHALLIGNGVGFWFLTMNFCVHAIMYTYYFFMSVSEATRKMVKPFAMLITLIQIWQMIAGLILVCLQFYLAQTDAHCAEVTHLGNNKLALGMYFSYFVLFWRVFKKSYIDKKPKK